jgi:hypothetical protein
MNIVKLSNWINLISQQHPNINYYHYGFESDINRTAVNNFDPISQEQTGKEYPALILEMPTQRTTQINNNSAEWDVVLNFFDTCEYDNLANSTTDTLVEKQNALQIIANDVIAALQKVATKSDPRTDALGFNDAVFVPLPYQHNDKLIQIQCSLTIRFKIECSAFVFDFGAIDPAFAYPVTSDDYEKIIP